MKNKVAINFDMLRHRLEVELESLLGGLEACLHPSDDGQLGNFPKSDDELASGKLESWKRAALEKRIREQLAEVEHALRKFEEGTYGLCDVCGQPIDAARLEALPRANLCYRCKIQNSSEKPDNDKTYQSKASLQLNQRG